MDSFTKKITIRWADLDPNFHVLHSKYYDFGAYCRMSFLTEHGISVPLMQQYHVGPIILREECIFKKEIRFEEDISINLFLDKISEDHKRWTMKHEIRKNENVLAALITLDGAWMDTELRKMTAPPEIFMEGMNMIPKTPGFQIMPA